MSTKAKVTVTILMLGSCHVLLNIPQLVYLVIFYSGNFHHHHTSSTSLLISDHSLKIIVILVFPLINCVSNIVIYFGRMNTLRLRAFQLLTLLRVYGQVLSDCIKYMCHENNRVVPSFSEQSDLSGVIGGRRPDPRHVKCMQLSEIIDSELASDEKKRYVDYLYQGDDDADKTSCSALES